MKELAMESDEFFKEVGVGTVEEAKRLASVNGLPTSHHELPVSFFFPKRMSFNFEPLPSFEIERIVQ